MPALRTSSFWLCLLAAGLLALAGCEKEEIHSYTVRRPPPETAEGKVRLVAAIFEHGSEQWFFKLVGPTEVVSAHAEAFATFVRSVRFTGKQDNPVEWTVPADWEKGKSGGLRYATFFMGPKDKAPEVGVFRFTEVSSLLKNVNRWRRLDLGRPPIQERQLAQLTKPIHAGENKGTLVDMSGPGVRGKDPHAGMGDVGGARHEAPAITYKTPAGWKDLGPQVRRGFRLVATFEVGDGEKASGEVMQMNFGGGLLLNVNRWRDQVGLPHLTQAQLDKNPPKKIEVAGVKASYHDFAGQEKRSLIVVVERGGKSWFFKLIGPSTVVARNKDKFESFVQSVKFTGAADE